MTATPLGSIVSCGAYVPRLRLPRAQIADAMRWLRPDTATPSGSRAVCNWDEDALTLAVEAARLCTARAGPETRIGSVSLASTTLPFADRSNATLLAGALDLPEDVETADVAGSLRAGTTALAQAARRRGGAARLVVASDARVARPGSPQEMEFGAGAAALLVTDATRDAGAVPALASILATTHRAADFVDHYRMQGEPFDYALEERWVRDEGLLKLVPAAIAQTLTAAAIEPARIDRIVLAAGASAAPRIARQAGLGHACLQDGLREECGDTGVAHPLLMLAAALDEAAPGEHVLVVGFGQGVDALLIRIAQERPPGAGRTVSDALARRKAEPNYSRYLSHSGLLDVDFGMRAERDNRSAHSVAWRKHRAVTAFVGGRCKQCATVQFPRSRVCVNPECRKTDTQADHRLADTIGRVKSFTEDWQAFSPRPPYVYGNVEFEGGGNLMMELTDVDSGEVAVGTRVRFVFRIKDRDALRGFRRYFWKAVQA